MKRIIKGAGRVAFWMAWPLYIVYFRLSERTRIIVVNGDEILVVKNWVGDGKWSLPGGGMHSDETPVEGAVRELYEEVGLQAEPHDLVFLVKGTYKSYGHSFVFHSFVLRLKSRTVIKKQFHEISDYAWVKPSELNIRNTSQDVLFTLEYYLR